MVKRMVFSIDESGEVTVSVEGAQGSECEKMTEPFESILGSVALKTHKDSYFADTHSHNEQSLESDQ